MEKWPSYLETVDKPFNSPGEAISYIGLEEYQSFLFCFLFVIC